MTDLAGDKESLFLPLRLPAWLRLPVLTASLEPKGLPGWLHLLAPLLLLLPGCLPGGCRADSIAGGESLVTTKAAQHQALGNDNDK